MADTVVSGECPLWLGPARGHQSLSGSCTSPLELTVRCGTLVEPSCSGFQEDVGIDPPQFTAWQQLQTLVLRLQWPPAFTSGTYPGFSIPGATDCSYLTPFNIHQGWVLCSVSMWNQRAPLGMTFCLSGGPMLSCDSLNCVAPDPSVSSWQSTQSSL